jgi:hypothetical protein
MAKEIVSQVKSSQVKSYSPGEHEGRAQYKPQGPVRWGRVVGMHAAAPAALWAAWDECTCADAALLATFLSELRVLSDHAGSEIRF